MSYKLACGLRRGVLLVLVTAVLSGCSTQQSNFVYTQERAAPTSNPADDRIAETAVEPGIELHFEGVSAMEHVVAQMEIGPRPTGSDGAHRTAQYISNSLSALGWDVTHLPFTYGGISAVNILASREHTGKPILLVGAHYDTRRVADQDPEYPDKPVPGANDGASGVAVLLELARILEPQNTLYDVMLVFFDAEDNGRLDGWEYAAGSRIFVENMAFQPAYFILVDMVGDKDQQLFYEGNSDDALQQELWSIAALLGYSSHFVPVQRYTMIDDHIAFVEQGIPAVDIIDFDYPYWHTTGDTIDKISSESLERVGRVIEHFIRVP